MEKIRNILKICSAKTYDIKGKAALIFFRFIILLLIGFFMLYDQTGSALNEKIHSPYIRWLSALAVVQFLSNGFLLRASDKFLKNGLALGLFIFDIALISLALFWTQGFRNDLFLIYFLVIFMTAIARKSSMSFLVAGVACLLYGFIFLETHDPSSLVNPSVLIRFPMLMVAAFFSSVIVEDAEKEKEALSNQMQLFWMHSEKMAALGEMASGISHEINNPMTSILGTAQLLIAESKNRKDAQASDAKPHENTTVSLEDIRVIERNAQRCQKIISALLNYSGDHDFRFEKVDVKDPLANALSLLANQIELSGIKVVWDIPQDLSPGNVFASPSHLEQVFFDLISNSIKAMGRGGVLTLGIRTKRVVNKREIPKDYVDIFIQDTGVGISQEDMEKLFQPFFTTRIGGNGTGLSLAVVHGIISKHNGKIIPESEGIGKGTKMTIRLPACGEDHGKQSGN